MRGGTGTPHLLVRREYRSFGQRVARAVIHYSAPYFEKYVIKNHDFKKSLPTPHDFDDSSQEGSSPVFAPDLGLLCYRFPI